MDQEPLPPASIPVNAAPLPPQPEVSPVPSSPRNSNPLFILAILVLLMAVGTGGIILGKSLNTSQPSAQPTVAPLPTQIPTPTPDLTANWETYKNEACGFEIKYPPEWQVEKDCVKGLGNELPVWDCLNSPDFRGYLGVPSDNIEQGTAITMDCDKGFEEKSIQTMVNECLEDKQKFPKEKYVCEIFKGQYINFTEIRQNEYHLISNKTSYTVIIATSFQTPPPVAKQILSTFKFTSP